MPYHPDIVVPITGHLDESIRQKLDSKTKPIGSLGVLEDLAFQMARIQATLAPQIHRPSMVVFASDHGVAKQHKVSAFPQEVTAQMVVNFIEGGAAINVFSRQHNIDLQIVDAGVASTLPAHPSLINAKIGLGTADYTKGAAMTIDQCDRALKKGGSIVEKIHQKGTNTIGFGEMGIGNTGTASLMMQQVTQFPLHQCVGKGTGLDEQQVKDKINILQSVLDNNGDFNDPIQILVHYGGFEIAMMVGAMIKAAALKMVLLIDGFYRQ